MKEIIVKTQAEWNALPKEFAEYTAIYIKDTGGLYIQVNQVPANSYVVARGSSHVEARESSHVEARESSHVEARESSHVVAWGSSHVVARESSHVEARESSHVVARGSSHVEARESSHVVAWGSSHVVAWGSSHVEARESSHVVARGSSHVEARESSHVVAWGSSHVEARESSHVVARGSSHVEARGSVSVHLHSDFATVALFMFAVCIAIAKGKIEKKSKTCTVVTPEKPEGTAGWLESQGIEKAKTILIFKRVSVEFKTQEGTRNETVWEVGATITHKSWSPESQECGEGKFHAVSRPFFADEFRNTSGDRYIAIEVAFKDLYAWPDAQYPHKIAFRSGKVVFECDRYGVEVK